MIGAFWTDEDPRVATDRIAEAVSATDVVFKKSGAVVAIGEDNVDARLRQWLRNVDLAEAGDYADAAGGQR